MSSPSDSDHLPAPAPPPHHPLPPSAPAPGPSPATHGASPPKPKSPIPTTAPPLPPEPNASAPAAAASSRSSPAETTSAAAAASARPEDRQSPPSGDASGAASTSAAIAAAAASARPEDCTPRMDMEFETELQGYDLYRLYAFKLGFNVRRRYTNRSKNTGEVTSCKFACSREGFKDQKPTGATASLPRAAARLSRAAAVPAPDGRTGCNAHLTLRRSKPGGTFQVSGFQPRHNHPLFAAPRGPHSPFHSPPNAAAAVIPPPDFVDDDATAGAACAEGEGPLRTRRQWEIKYGEAAALLNYLQRQSLADPAFHHAVQLDVEDKVANVFWVDAKMVADYAHFGDVVAFDVVSRNSISLRHLASFVGCNSFGEPVVFGMALMYDETCESFRWLFQTFLRVMSGRAPKTFFSHQDMVIAEALSLAMPGTTTAHAICTWHIKHAAKGNIRQLSKGDANFIEEFKACVDGEYDEEAEFLAAWDSMISKHELCDNAWLQKLFEEKQKWARPYAKAIFSAGMEGTRLNERLNSEVRSHLRAEVDIVLFLRHLQNVISDRRYRGLEMEYGSRLMMPYLKIKAPILTQASEVYTSVIFQLFQEEYEEFQSAYIVSRDESGPCREYVVSLVGKEDQRYTVYGDPMEQTVSCSCGKFEMVGFLCSHALKILDVMDIKYIPERYIMKRWTKYARRLTPPEVHGQAEKSSEISSRYQHLCPKYVRLVARASECEESSRVLDQFWGELGEKVEQILQKQTSITAPMTQPDVQNLKMALSSITSVTESENVLEKSSSAAAKTVKKKGQKSKNHPRNCIEKGLTKKQRVHSEEPAVVQYGFIDGPPAQSGNAMYQGLEAPPNMSGMGSQTPAYKTYMGTDFSNSMGTINYEGMHPGATLGFTLLPSQELGFVPCACHTSQASNDSQHSQTL